MKFVQILFLLSLFIASAFTGFSQKPSPRIAVVNQVNPWITHVYVDPWSNLKNTNDMFNYGEYAVNDLLERFESSNVEAVEMQTPIWFSTKSYLNFIEKPNKKFRMWLTTLKQKHDVDYLIVFLHKWNPDPDINFNFLNELHYGVASYAASREAITLFSLVGCWIYATDDFRRIELNPNHDKYVITNVNLEERMSFVEIRELPDKYYKLCSDKIRNVADTRNAEIWRVMNREIAQ